MHTGGVPVACGAEVHRSSWKLALACPLTSLSVCCFPAPSLPAVLDFVSSFLQLCRTVCTSKHAVLVCFSAFPHSTSLAWDVLATHLHHLQSSLLTWSLRICFSRVN